MPAPPGSDSMPLGATGRLEVLSLRSPSGDHAALVRDADAPRALLSTSRGVDGAERIVVTPLDDGVEVRVDGDALAIWLASGSLSGPARPALPGWASGLGLGLVVLLAALAVVGGATVFSWLVGW
jgi:hypothetical protein